MLGQKSTVSFDKTKALLEADLTQRYENISKHIDSINITKGALGASVRNAGLFMSRDSKVCSKDANRDSKPCVREIIPDETKTFIDKNMDSLMKSGVSESEARKRVMNQLDTWFGQDKATGEYVMTAKPASENPKAVFDSLLQQTSIPMWNIGWLQRIIKQPFVDSHAKNLVAVESFNNPWADLVGLFKESFEGYGKLSNTARGNVKQNNSNPVTNEAGQIIDQVFNISVDYESDTMEDLKAKQAGNFITGQLKADREKYAQMILERMQDALIYFGSQEAGIDGLMDVAAVEQYTGTPLYSIFMGTSQTKGSEIIMAMNRVIGNFLRENHYMARKVKINVSEYVFQALTQTVYSDVYNPQSPLEILTGNFKGRSELDGGLVQCSYEIVSDSMLNPNTPFNPTNHDLMFITVPTINDALTGIQDSLIIHPELLKSYIVPAMWQRQGILYTMYKRIGGVIAPVAGTVKCIEGFGFNGD